MKRDAAEDIVSRIDFAKQRTGLPHRSLCRAMGISHRTFKRWRCRKENGLPLVNAPGPSKTEPFDPAVLAGELVSLPHGVHRIRGMGLLHAKYCRSLSRRELDFMASMVREEDNDIRRRNLLRVTWVQPGLVWAIDGTEFTEVPGGWELMTIRDLCSKYLFRPLVTQWTPCNEEVAGHLVTLLHDEEDPLFLKMDNGGNLVGQTVMSMLADKRIIPLVSPPHYPRYNGSLEKTQGDIKETIRTSLPLSRCVTHDELALYAALAAHDLNHRPKGVLRDRTACQVLRDNTGRIRFTEKERMVIYEWINENQQTILQKAQIFTNRAVANARRQAIEAWLLKNDMIRLTRNGKSVTQLSGKKGP